MIIHREARPDHPTRFAGTPPVEGNYLQPSISIVFFANLAAANQFPSGGGVDAKRTGWFRWTRSGRGGSGGREADGVVPVDAKRTGWPRVAAGRGGKWITTIV